MRYEAFATDGDGTLFRGHALSGRVTKAVERLRDSECKVILVTGEARKDYGSLARTGLFDLIIGENGGVLYRPGAGVEELLAAPAPRDLVRALRRKKVRPLTVGRVMVASKRPQVRTLRQTLRELGLDWEIAYNRDNIMALPAGIDKASGLAAGLRELGIRPCSVVGVGDGENDAALVSACGLGVAVADAVPKLKRCANLVTRARGPDGVLELLERMIASDLPGPSSSRQPPRPARRSA